MSKEDSLLAFNEDFQNLLEIKKYLIQKLRDLREGYDWPEALKLGIMEMLPNGRKTRFVLPRSREETLKLLEQSGLDQSLTFVGFIGYSKPIESIREAVIKQIWDADTRLIEEFQNQKYILAYVTAEREIGGNWFNLVLCSSNQAITDWHNLRFHSMVATEISPSYYSHVRIHRGTLPSLDSEKFHVSQTTFLSYPGNSEPYQIQKHCHLWKTSESSQYFVTKSSS